MLKRDRFEEFEKKWISDSDSNNNKKTFKTTSAYQLAVKNLQYAVPLLSISLILPSSVSSKLGFSDICIQYSYEVLSVILL